MSDRDYCYPSDFSVLRNLDVSRPLILPLASVVAYCDINFPFRVPSAFIPAKLAVVPRNNLWLSNNLWSSSAVADDFMDWTSAFIPAKLACLARYVSFILHTRKNPTYSTYSLGKFEISVASLALGNG